MYCDRRPESDFCYYVPIRLRGIIIVAGAVTRALILGLLAGSNWSVQLLRILRLSYNSLKSTGATRSNLWRLLFCQIVFFGGHTYRYYPVYEHTLILGPLAGSATNGQSLRTVDTLNNPLKSLGATRNSQ